LLWFKGEALVALVGTFTHFLRFLMAFQFSTTMLCSMNETFCVLLKIWMIGQYELIPLLHVLSGVAFSFCSFQLLCGAFT